MALCSATRAVALVDLLRGAPGQRETVWVRIHGDAKVRRQARALSRAWARERLEQAQLRWRMTRDHESIPLRRPRAKASGSRGTVLSPPDAIDRRSVLVAAVYLNPIEE